MKLLNNKYILSWVIMLVTFSCATAQDSVTHELILNLNYYLQNNQVPYLKVSAKEKVERKFIPQQNIEASVYLGERSDAGLLGKIKTDKKGEAKVYIPSAFKALWDSSATLSFSVVTQPDKIFSSTTAELTIAKAKMEIDTITEDEIKKVNVKVIELKDGQWIAANNVEFKIAVKRSLGNVPIGDEETYTTDSTGMISAEYKRDSLPGDAKGNITLVAWTEDHETLGNISCEKLINWGVPVKMDNTFFEQRTLWATRFKTPIWLLALAYSITIGVWGTLIYLIIKIIKIRNLGKATE